MGNLLTRNINSIQNFSIENPDQFEKEINNLTKNSLYTVNNESLLSIKTHIEKRITEMENNNNKYISKLYTNFKSSFNFSTLFDIAIKSSISSIFSMIHIYGVKTEIGNNIYNDGLFAYYLGIHDIMFKSNIELYNKYHKSAYELYQAKRDHMRVYVPFPDMDDKTNIPEKIKSNITPSFIIGNIFSGICLTVTSGLFNVDRTYNNTLFNMKKSLAILEKFFTKSS